MEQPGGSAKKEDTVNLSIVIPAKNEQDNIRPLVSEIANVLNDIIDFELIYVDDGSSDNTYGEIKQLAESQFPQLCVIRHRYPVGQSTAIATGVRHAKGPLIVTMDADGQNDPADIPKMLNIASGFPLSTHFCIAGYRKCRKDTAWKRLQSRIANRVRGAILADDTPDTGCGLKLFPRHTFLQLPYFDHMHRFLPALIKRLGGRIEVVEVNHRDRQAGVSKYTMLSRLGVGIVDMLGVLWLQRRTQRPELVFDDE